MGGLLLPDWLVEVYLLVGPVTFFIAGWILRNGVKVSLSPSVSPGPAAGVLVPVATAPPAGAGVIPSPAPAKVDLTRTEVAPDLFEVA